ncbi:hypothetical protein Ndes2526B_g04368 [Nannochloris sp. 'desiccata']
MTSGLEHANGNSTAYESFVGVHHTYIIIGLAVPCVFLIAFGAYISHFQGRCDGLVRIFCPCLPTIWDEPPRRREVEAIVVPPTRIAKKKTLNPDEFACVVVMPDKSCQVAYPQFDKGAAVRPPCVVQITASPVVLLEATVAGSPLPNSNFSSPNQQQLIAPVSPKHSIEVLSQVV